MAKEEMIEDEIAGWSNKIKMNTPSVHFDQNVILASCFSKRVSNTLCLYVFSAQSHEEELSRNSQTNGPDLSPFVEGNLKK